MEIEKRRETTETAKQHIAFCLSWILKMGTAFSVDCTEQVQKLYLEVLIPLAHDAVERACSRAIREWTEYGMPRPAFLLERTKPPLSNPIEQEEQDRRESQRYLPCDLCKGQGHLAVFFEEWADGYDRRRRFADVMPYGEAQGKEVPPGWTRFYYRCTCPAGDRRPNGLPRWKPELREKTA